MERGTRDLKVLYKPPLQVPSVEASPTTPPKAATIPASPSLQPNVDLSRDLGNSMEIDEEVPLGDLEAGGISTGQNGVSENLEGEAELLSR